MSWTKRGNTYRSENSQRSHVRLRVEDVVDDAFEVEGVVGVLHDIVVVRTLQLEWMREDVRPFRTTHFTGEG